jgi:uncharacterized repeat protein (TIGR01451 family)
VVAVTALLLVPLTAFAATDVAVRMAGGSGASIGLGEQVVYSIDVRNEGTEPALAVTLTDSLPAGVEPVSVQTSQGACALGDTVTCAFGTLEPNGGYASVYIETRTRVEGQWHNTASIESETEDPNPANDRATVVIDVTGPVPRVSEVAMTRSVFRVGTRSAIAFVMSRPATVTFRVERRIRGRGWVRAGTPFIRRAAEGENLVAFSGRVRRNGRLRALRPGVYRAQLTAVDRLGGRSVPRAVRFRVVR